METTVDTRRGLGTIHKGNKKLGTVEYSLEVLQDYMDVSTLTGKGKTSGWTRGVGQINPQDIAIHTLINAGKLALQLEEGDWIDVLVSDTSGTVKTVEGFYKKP